MAGSDTGAKETALREVEHGQCQRLDHGQNLRHQQDLAAIEPVNPNPGEWGENKSRYLSRESHHAQ